MSKIENGLTLSTRSCRFILTPFHCPFVLKNKCLSVDHFDRKDELFIVTIICFQLIVHRLTPTD